VNADALVWLAPTIAAMFAWGIAQGLVKKYIGEVPPARFCLYYAIANAVVNAGYWIWKGTFSPFGADHVAFVQYGLLAYVLDGIAWIFYYQSIVYGPISIVGTLSAAYPALAVIFSRMFLAEQLSVPQYFGVTLVILGCLGLAYEPHPPEGRKTHRRWMVFAGTALLIWGINGVILKKAYLQDAANSGDLALYNAIGGLLTLGIYGTVFGRKGAAGGWTRSFGPMATMALGGLLALIAYDEGPVSIVTPLSGAYPVVTLGFAWLVLKERPGKLHWGCIAGILVGMVLCTMTVEHEPEPEPGPETPATLPAR
jgi:drug/metabolite transporter (DMT)-like permease